VTACGIRDDAGRDRRFVRHSSVRTAPSAQRLRSLRTSFERLSTMPHRAATPAPFAPAVRVLLHRRGAACVCRRSPPGTGARADSEANRLGSPGERETDKEDRARWRRLIP
jgi:hypothetical protein